MNIMGDTNIQSITQDLSFLIHKMEMMINLSVAREATRLLKSFEVPLEARHNDNGV